MRRDMIETCFCADQQDYSPVGCSDVSKESRPSGLLARVTTESEQ
jgi:hypothetical protein